MTVKDLPAVASGGRGMFATETLLPPATTLVLTRLSGQADNGTCKPSLHRKAETAYHSFVVCLEGREGLLAGCR